jgi:5'-nucleotidase
MEATKRGRETMRVMIDLDGVLADFNNAVINHFKELGYERSDLFLRTYDISKWYDADNEEVRQEFVELMGTKGFWLSLRLMPGAVDALKEIKKLGHEIYILTTPWWSSPVSLTEKWGWIKRKLGRVINPCEQVLYATNKSIIDGDILIDDKLKHIQDWLKLRPFAIVFDWPYNRDSESGSKAYRASNWGEVVEIVSKLTAK